MWVMALGAVCFGFVVGYITYRTLARTAEKAVVTDLTVVVSVIGGAAVTGLFNPDHGDLFGWYAIGLVIGLAAFLVLHLVLSGRESTINVMGVLPRKFFGRSGRSDKVGTPQS
jgi:O-antigen/teichoic acid export membrane protein